ncbi:MAG TPA: 3-methyl-2-oxobutanoate hydroxymethyltransferase [Pyrinomonadaceae bacterium]|nr:3-methyl-2-oxobutanoate hydroxymethyltransferase [Pyrinomonadaceae bacterium]
MSNRRHLKVEAQHGGPKSVQPNDARTIRLLPGSSSSIEAKAAVRPMTVLDFQKMKNEGRKISMITCYDYSSARAVAQSSVDCILVGDSVAMTMHGYPNTLSATTTMMAMHTAAVARGAPSKFIVGDMPFLSYRKGLKEAMDCVHELMSAGAHSVKLEGVRGHAEIVRHIADSGVPVMGHLGLTPQSVNQLGGMKVQAKTDAAVELLASQARELEDAGCFALVLECVPAEAARKVTELLTIPTIGIGAGPAVSGQVLVYQDLLGLNPSFKPKFLRTYASAFEMIHAALDSYNDDVKRGEFPSENESYS